MTRPLYVRQNETTSDYGDRIVLYYFILDSIKNSEFDIDSYDIGIEMYTQLPNERSAKDKEIVESVFTDFDRAKKMVDILCDGFVTPVTLKDILYDYITQDAM